MVCTVDVEHVISNIKLCTHEAIHKLSNFHLILFYSFSISTILQVEISKT